MSTRQINFPGSIQTDETLVLGQPFTKTEQDGGGMELPAGTKLRMTKFDSDAVTLEIDEIRGLHVRLRVAQAYQMVFQK